MVLYNLIPSPIDCAREAVYDPCLHLDNGADGVENEVGYVMTQAPNQKPRPSYLLRKTLHEALHVDGFLLVSTFSFICSSSIFSICNILFQQIMPARNQSDA